MSTISKTAVDWDNYKDKEGIDEELRQKARDGYVERREFLNRTDWRQFELEREEREAERRRREAEAAAAERKKQG
eukprot:g6065.t1